jgi:hypothetical protein
MEQGAKGKSYKLGRLTIDARGTTTRDAMSKMSLAMPVTASNAEPPARGGVDHWGLPTMEISDSDDDVEEIFTEARQDRFRLGEAYPALMPPETQERNQNIEAFNVVEANSRARYMSEPRRTWKLRELKSLYQRKDGQGFLDTLKMRSSFVFDPDTRLDAREGKEIITAESSRIDFKCIVGNRTGLGVILRRSATNQTSSFTLQLNSPHLQFHHSHGELGLDPAGNMLYIGDRGSEEVWLGWAEDTEGDVEPSGPPGSATHLNAKRYRIAVMFFAYCLSKMPTMAVTFNPKKLDTVTFDSSISAGVDLAQMTNIL